MSFKELFNLLMPLEHAQFHVQDTDVYRSYQEAAASTAAPKVSHDVPMTSDCYRPSLDGVHDLNAPEIPFSTIQMMSPEYVHHTMYGFDLFGGTPPSTFTAAHIDPSTFGQQHHDDDQNHQQLQQPEDGQGRPMQEIRLLQCHTGCPLPAPRRHQRNG